MTEISVKEAIEYWKGSRQEAIDFLDSEIIDKEYRDQVKYYDFIISTLEKLERGELVEVKKDWRYDDRPAERDIRTLYRHTAYWVEQNDLTMIVNAYFDLKDEVAGLKRENARLSVKLEDFRQKVINGELTETCTCENCKYLLESEKTNRLWCSYYSDGEYQHEVFKSDYCSYGERRCDK